jgi:hypothetical protein
LPSIANPRLFPIRTIRCLCGPKIGLTVEVPVDCVGVAISGVAPGRVVESIGMAILVPIGDANVDEVTVHDVNVVLAEAENLGLIPS